ncbi:MAG: FHA domain-containing protein [Chitinophagales bacterium]
MITILIAQNNRESIVKRIYNYDEQIITIGRFNHSGSKKVDIVLPDNNLLSRNHGYLKIHSNGRISFTDESKLGSILDGKTLNRQTIILKKSSHEISFNIEEDFKIIVKNEAISKQNFKENKSQYADHSLMQEVLGKTVKLNLEKALRDKSVITIGRGSENDVVLDSLNISRSMQALLKRMVPTT